MGNTAQVANYLRLGVEAARAGQHQTAQKHLNAVLEVEPNNSPALFWLAYVASSPQESLQLLAKVLALDPDNERAKAGVRWANQRIQADSLAQIASAPTVTIPLASTQPETPVKTSSLPAVTVKISLVAPPPTKESTAEEVTATEVTASEIDSSPQAETVEMPDEFVKSELLSKEKLQKQAKKSVLAHRARRNLNPLLVMILLLGITVLMTVGVGLFMLTPSNTLAAWLPAVATGKAPTQIETISALPATVVVAPTDDAPLAKTFTSSSDTLIFNTPIPADATSTETDVDPATAHSLRVDNGDIVAEETAKRSIDELPQVINTAPIELIGPVQDEPSEVAEPDATTEETVTTGEEITENPALTSSINELISNANEILNGPRLFEPVDETLLPHQPAFPNEKWIEVDVTLQQIVAWEGNTPIMSFIGSTGLPNTPTVLGEYNVYWKLEKTLMSGADYYLPDVPYTMYFYSGYAIHGTYWHDNFGQPMSHGCVNLTNDNAKQIFEWADPIIPVGQTQVTATYENPGTLVVVHE